MNQILAICLKLLSVKKIKTNQTNLWKGSFFNTMIHFFL